MLSSSSRNSGNRPCSFFEKMSAPSSVISNTPPELFTSPTSTSRAFLSSAARLTARGRYPQEPQYVISSFFIGSSRWM
jgi:hypothetical protein